ncbi:MAG: lytic transglycosylase domain-containing protein [Sphingobium sp.]|nr:lytic transglycosylase domain-containing protein [Sphingobium sp.]
MAAMGKDLRIALRLTGLVSLAALVIAATDTPASKPDSGAISWQAVTRTIEASGDQDRRVAAALDRWRSLTRTETAGFAAYADFLQQYPGWPEEARLRGLAERSVDATIDSPSTITAFFARFPARTAQGKAANALALARLNRTADAQAAARDAWGAGPLSLPLEQALLAQFSASLTPADHLRHADAVLWRRGTDAAERVLAYVPVTRRAVVEARIAMQRKAPDAALKVAIADPVGVMDAGYLADKARWLTDSGDEIGARKLLAERMALSQTPANVEEWYEVLLAKAKNAAKDGDWATAYAIASRVDDAYAPNTDVSAQPLGERDDYTSLTWLAGTAALNHLGRAAEAEGMFARYSAGGQSPPTRTKGLYWAGRAALAAGRKESAQDWFAQAGALPDQYYGQLALERLGRRVPAPRGETQVILTANDRAAFTSQPVVRAAQMLGEQGNWGDQSKFVRTIATTAVTERDHALAAELSRTLGRPDLGVMAGRRATASGLSAYDKASFPHMKVPEGQGDNWTMIHAIARQESQFDRAIVSYAGARGLMQLMPATAREQAGKAGLTYDESALFDPDFNVTLGSNYFVKLLSYYNGSYPLAVAAYNAGMGNVNKWIRANGDPRLPGADIVQWIEDIPIYQTKDYVQRVLENAVVYDLMNPLKDGSAAAPATPLSHYLGKSNPG